MLRPKFANLRTAGSHALDVGLARIPVENRLPRDQVLGSLARQLGAIGGNRQAPDASLRDSHKPMTFITASLVGSTTKGSNPAVLIAVSGSFKP